MKIYICIMISFLMSGFVVGGEKEEKSPKELVEMYHRLSAKYDFESLATYVHPYTLSEFRKITEDLMTSLAKKHSEQAVFGAFTGIDSISDFDNMSDSEFWAYIMGSVYSYSEERSWSKKIEVVGKVRKKKFLYFLYQYKSDLKVTPENEKMITPRIFTFMEYEGAWRYYSFEIGQVVKYINWYAKYQYPAESSEVATHPSSESN